MLQTIRTQEIQNAGGAAITEPQDSTLQSKTRSGFTSMLSGSRGTGNFLAFSNLPPPGKNRTAGFAAQGIDLQRQVFNVQRLQEVHQHEDDFRSEAGLSSPKSSTSIW
jgi:hypothetical protein